MTPEQATFLSGIELTHIREEWGITRKILEAVPDDNLGYRPDPKARDAIDLCWHIAMCEVWFLESLLSGEFSMEEPQRPENVKTPADVVAWYEERVPGLIEKVAEIPGEQMATPLSFFGAFNYPAVIYLSFAVAHTVHHRGQLATYLRPMGSKVPAIYGGSADEPFEIPHHQ